MLRNFKAIAFGLTAAMISSAAFAQTVKFHGVKNSMRYDDGEDTKYEYLGWNSETGKAEFKGDVGLWTLSMNGNSISSELEHYDNLMYGNSGSIFVGGKIYTVMSHEDPDADTSDVMEFVVRTWDANTYELLETRRFPKSANIESRGMTYNPTNGKVYGLFYLTDVMLPVGVEELDEEDIQEGYTTDAGYALCTIDLNTMELTQITPGVYYDNFVTLACSPEGKLFSMTSGGTLVEFNASTGLIRSKHIINGEGVSESTNFYEHSGVESQFKRQAACFDHNTGKMYWNGYVNSGKGINDWGSWSNLSDREWRTNGKYDTALYEVDTKTGKATKIALIPNRIAFSCLWVEGGDGTTAIEKTEAQRSESSAVEIFDLSGKRIFCGDADNANLKSGIYLVKNGLSTKKVILK